MTWQTFIDSFLKILSQVMIGETPKYQDDAPVPNGVPKPEPKPDLIQKMCEAIKEFEGWTPGSASYRRNNPGNIKGLKGGFLVFKTPEAGFAYLKDYVTRACTGKHPAYKPTFTLRQFFSVYAPDGDKVIDNYTSFVAKRMGVFPSIKLKDLL